MTAPEIPGAAALLGDAARDVLAAAMAIAGAQLLDVRVTQVHYQPDRRMTVRYRAGVRWADGTDRTETLCAVAQTGGVPDGVVEVEDGLGARVGVWRYPHDPWLPGLPDAAGPDAVGALLHQMGLDGMPPGGEDGGVEVDPVVYRPRQRAVLRVGWGSGAVYLKVVRPDALPRITEVHDRLAGRLPAPTCAGVDPDRGVLALEPIVGVPLTRPLVDGEALPRPGAVLELTHALAGVSLPASAASAARPSAAVAHAELLRRVLPSSAERVDALARRASADGARSTRTIHGDLHHGQVIVDADGAVRGVVDVEGVRVGSPDEDPATFVAHLVGLAHVKPRARARIDAYRSELCAALPPTVDRDLLHRGVLAAMLGLATTPFRRQERDWSTRTGEWLDRCQEWARSPL